MEAFTSIYYELTTSENKRLTISFQNIPLLDTDIDDIENDTRIGIYKGKEDMYYKYKCSFDYNNKGFDMDYITNEYPSKEKMMLVAVSYALQAYENETFDLFCDVYNYDDDNIELGLKRYIECNEIEYKLHHMLGETLFNRFAECELYE